MVTCDRSYDKFNKNFLTVLNKHARKIENRFVVTKNPHINESLRHEIVKRSKLKNKDNKMDIKNDKKQRNYVVQSNKKATLEHFNTFISSQRK